MKLFLNRNKKILLLIAIILLLYLPSLNNFFSADDWFHLRISMVENFNDVFQFFSLTQNNHTAAFYRPLSTQLFFAGFYYLFKLNVVFYHIFIIAVFGLVLFLVYKVTKELFVKENLALLTTFFYGFSVSNFTRVYFISAFQEILMTLFSLLCIHFYLKKEDKKNLFLSLMMLVLALLSKETAVVVPIILLMTNWLKGKFDKKISLFFILVVLYAIARISFFGLAQGDSYLWDFSPLKTANTFFWYFLWALGAPEFLVDYVSSGIRIVPRFFQVLPGWSYLILILILLALINLSGLCLLNLKKINKRIFFSGLFFLIGLLPVLFLPWHKFSLELSLPLVGFALFLSFLTIQSNKKQGLIFILFFLSLNFTSYYLTFLTHYSVNRAKIAKKVFTYIVDTHPYLDSNQTLEFINGTNEDAGAWGVSKQISQAVSGSEMFKVMYKDQSLKVYYQDLDDNLPTEREIIKINSLPFLQN